MLDVCLLGTSGMLPLPGRWLTSLMTRYNGSSLMIDCGEGTQIAVKQKGWSFNPIDVICFTHYHADHISGLPGLLLTIGNSDRKKPLTLVGPKGLGRVVSSLRVIAPELPFELRLIELTNQQEHLSICYFKSLSCRTHNHIRSIFFIIYCNRCSMLQFIPHTTRNTKFFCLLYIKLAYSWNTYRIPITYNRMINPECIYLISTY